MNFLINFYVNWQKQLTLNVLHSMEVWDRLSLVLIELNLCSISSVGVQGVEGQGGGLCEHGGSLWRRLGGFTERDRRWEQGILTNLKN